MITKTFSVDGKRYYVRAKTESEAIQKLALKKSEIEKGIIAIDSNMLVKDWADKCVKTYKADTKEITLNSFVDVMQRCVLQYIGNLRLKDVKPIQCQEIMNRQIGNSKSRIAHVYQALRFIFSKAKANGLIYTDPTDSVIKPKGYEHKRRELTDYEREHFLKCCEDDRFLIFRVMLDTGLRPSEARELKGFDVQMIKNVPVLHVRGTKTERADRYVPLSQELYDKLIDSDPFLPLFKNGIGERHNSKTFSSLWHHLVREMNISMGCRVYRNQVVPPYRVADDLVPYCLRHTFACDLMRKNLGIPQSVLLMGHTTADLFVNTYTHSSEDIVVEANSIIHCCTATSGATQELRKIEIF